MLRRARLAAPLTRRHQRSPRGGANGPRSTLGGVGRCRHASSHDHARKGRASHSRDAHPSRLPSWPRGPAWSDRPAARQGRPGDEPHPYDRQRPNDDGWLRLPVLQIEDLAWLIGILEDWLLHAPDDAYDVLAEFAGRGPFTRPADQHGRLIARQLAPSTDGGRCCRARPPSRPLASMPIDRAPKQRKKGQRIAVVLLTTGDVQP